VVKVEPHSPRSARSQDDLDRLLWFVLTRPGEPLGSTTTPARPKRLDRFTCETGVVGRVVYSRWRASLVHQVLGKRRSSTPCVGSSQRGSRPALPSHLMVNGSHVTWPEPMWREWSILPLQSRFVLCELGGRVAWTVPVVPSRSCYSVDLAAHLTDSSSATSRKKTLC
jgi:hypothetical protein